MRLDDNDLRQVLFCVSAELRARRAGKPPGVQPWLVKLENRLELEVAVSGSGQDFGGGLQPLSGDQSWIGTRAAAARLGWSTRTVRRRHADLDGRLVGDGWIFPEHVVDEYAEAVTDGDIA